MRSRFGTPALGYLFLENLMRKVKVYFPRVYSGNLQENPYLCYLVSGVPFRPLGGGASLRPKNRHRCLKTTKLMLGGARMTPLSKEPEMAPIWNPSMRGLIYRSASPKRLFEQDNRFLQKQIHKALKMDLKEAVKFGRNRGLNLAYFGKDLPKLVEGSKDCNIFGVFTRSGGGDELYYPEGDVNTLGNWIRCGDPTGLLPEWREVDASGLKSKVNASSLKLKVYLAGENPGIDCTSVMDDMFATEGGESYTYVLSREIKTITKITHPQDYLDLSISPTLLNSQKLTFI
jgi:hypothetical protein